MRRQIRSHIGLCVWIIFSLQDSPCCDDVSNAKWTLTKIHIMWLHVPTYAYFLFLPIKSRIFKKVGNFEDEKYSWDSNLIFDKKSHLAYFTHKKRKSKMMELTIDLLKNDASKTYFRKRWIKTSNSFTILKAILQRHGRIVLALFPGLRLKEKEHIFSSVVVVAAAAPPQCCPRGLCSKRSF